MTCYRTATGRGLLGRHLDTCDGTTDGQPCHGCQPCPEEHCRDCKVNHAHVLCPTCLSTIRGDLAAVLLLTGHLAEEAMTGRPAYVTHNNVPGGNALVMLAPGANRHTYLKQIAARLERGLSTAHVHDEAADDPQPPLAVLTYWVEAWSHQTPTRRGSLDEAVRYLDEHLHEKATSPGVLVFGRDVQRLRRTLEDVLHDGERAEVTRVPCWECGARLVKVYGQAVKDDHWECPRCRAQYDQGRYDRAKYDHLASTGAERYVLVTDAVGAIGRPEQTVRAWIRKGLVDTRRDDLTGRLLIWWPHVRARHLETPRRARRTSP